MPCEHAETTTVLWLYGEGSEGHAAHVATCQACTEVLHAHSDVICAVGDALPALRDATQPASVTVRPSSGWRFAPLLLAAAALLVVLVQHPPESTVLLPTPVLAPVAAVQSTPSHIDAAWSDDLDLRLEAVSTDVDFLSLNLGTL